jgi:hypothetical protein
MTDLKTGFVRLEEFIEHAREGKKVSVEVGLRKDAVTQKVHPEESETMSREMYMYLLIGDFVFKVDGEKTKVSKVYMYGSAEESLDAARIDRHIANQRLKMDYQRLKDVKIEVEEKYFE